MVIDSLNFNLRQVSPIYLRLSGNVHPPPPTRIGKVGVRQRPLVEGGSTMMEALQMESEIAILAAWWR